METKTRPVKSERYRVGAKVRIFLVGEGERHAGWEGEIVDTTQREIDGSVTVRWRRPLSSMMELESVGAHRLQVIRKFSEKFA